MTSEHKNLLNFGPMGCCVHLRVCIMAPQGKELPEGLKVLIVSLHKDGKGYRKICYLTKNQLKHGINHSYNQEV